MVVVSGFADVLFLGPKYGIDISDRGHALGVFFFKLIGNVLQQERRFSTLMHAELSHPQGDAIFSFTANTRTENNLQITHANIKKCNHSQEFYCKSEIVGHCVLKIIQVFF